MERGESGTTLAERVSGLEQLLEERIAAADRSRETLDSRVRRLEAAALVQPERAWLAPKPPAVPASVAFTPVIADSSAPPRQQSGGSAAERGLTAMSVSDLIGGRVLAWLGGAAVLLGLVLFLALAFSHGWIGQEARVAIAGLVSLALMTCGAWLHDHRGRTEAAVVMVGAATAGMYVTLIVASEVYGVIPGYLSVAGSMVAGAYATRLAIRWAGRPIGALGLLGALASPVLVGSGSSSVTIAMLGVAAACAIAVVVWQRWTWLGLAAILIAAPQWGAAILGDQPLATVTIVLVTFTALGVAATLGSQLRGIGDQISPSITLLAALNAFLAAGIGSTALWGQAGPVAAEVWLTALAVVHIALGLQRHPRTPISAPLRPVLLTLGVILADIAFGLSADGITLALGWSAAAITFAWLSRSTARENRDHSMLGIGLGVHLALVLIRTLIAAPPGQLATGDANLLALMSICLLAATSFACGRLTDAGHPGWRVALDGIAMLAIAYLTASAIDGPALIAAWAFEGLALMRLASHEPEGVGRLGAFGFLGLAALQTLTTEAPPDALLTGAPDLAAAAIALGAMATATLLAGQAQPARAQTRAVLFAAAAGCILYLASMTCITAFQPTAQAIDDTVLDLGVRQQGQVLLSALWSITGLAGLIYGLRRQNAHVRTAALGLLLIAVGKVFLYDLSTLTSIYRVIPFIVLGLLLLAGAFAYQRLRPPARDPRAGDTLGPVAS